MSKKKVIVLTDEEKYELDVQAENELALKKRQYRTFESQRGKCDLKVNLQRCMLSILRKEWVAINDDLQVAISAVKKVEDSKLSTALLTLLTENDFFDSQIVEKKAHLREIDSQIKRMEKSVLELASKQITDNEIQIRILAGYKTVECLETKLDAAVKRFCMISTENRRLREEIHHLILERDTFNKLWETLLGNLFNGKSFLLDLVQQATVAYNQRDEMCSKLQVLRKRAHGDLISHTQEMIMLQRKMDHGQNLNEYMTIKGQKREMQMLYEQKMKNIFEMRQKLNQQFTQYQKELLRVINFSGLDNVKELAKDYIKREELNFSLFNYFNVVYTELEGTANSLVALYAKIDAQKSLNETRALRQTENLITLTTNMKLAQKAADTRQGELNKTRAKLQKLYTGIEKLFKICKCNNEPFMQLLGDNTQVNDYNILLYLRMLESRITEIITNSYYKQKTVRGAAANILQNVYGYKPHMITEIVPTNPCPLCVEQEQVSDIIDELQFVQDKAEVKLKLVQRLALPDGLDRLHNVSVCHLPKSREIIQKRFQ